MQKGKKQFVAINRLAKTLGCMWIVCSIIMTGCGYDVYGNLNARGEHRLFLYWDKRVRKKAIDDEKEFARIQYKYYLEFIKQTM